MASPKRAAGTHRRARHVRMVGGPNCPLDAGAVPPHRSVVDFRLAAAHRATRRVFDVTRVIIQGLTAPRWAHVRGLLNTVELMDAAAARCCQISICHTRLADPPLDAVASSASPSRQVAQLTDRRLRVWSSSFAD